MSNRFLAIALIFIALAFVGCTKNDDSTIILLGDESYVRDIKDVINQNLLDSLSGLEWFPELPSGTVPPKIEGEFLMNKNLLYWSNFEDFIFPDDSTTRGYRYLRFFDQHNMVAKYENEMVWDFNENSESDTVYIAGSGNDFTIYLVESLTDSYSGVFFTRGTVITGKIEANGIRNLIIAYVVIDKKDDPYDIGLYPIGTIIIFIDEDGFSERCDAQSNNNSKESESYSIDNVIKNIEK